MPVSVRAEERERGSRDSERVTLRRTRRERRSRRSSTQRWRRFSTRRASTRFPDGTLWPSLASSRAKKLARRTAVRLVRGGEAGPSRRSRATPTARKEIGEIHFQSGAPRGVSHRSRWADQDEPGEAPSRRPVVAGERRACERGGRDAGRVTLRRTRREGRAEVDHAALASLIHAQRRRAESRCRAPAGTLSAAFILERRAGPSRRPTERRGAAAAVGKLTADLSPPPRRSAWSRQKAEP